MIPPHLLEREDIRSEEEKRQGLQQMRREVQEQIRRKREAGEQTAEEQWKAVEEENAIEEQKGKGEQTPDIRLRERVRHRKYGEGILVSEDDMMIEAEFPGYGRKQFLKAFGEVERI